MKASFIIPAHNEEKYLSLVLDSLSLLGSAIDFDVIVVNVASVDATPEIAREYGCNVIDAGLVSPGVARNIGANVSDADVFVFLDADVLITRNWVSGLIEIIEEGIIQEGLVGSPYRIRDNPSWIERVWFSADFAREPTYINAGNLVVLRKIFDSIGGFDPEMSTGEDYDFCERARANGFGVIIDKRLLAIHLGYPSGGLDFILREAWHGSGDLKNFSSFLSSKVSIASFLFSALLFISFLSFLRGFYYLLSVAFLGLLSLALLVSYKKWGAAGGVLDVLKATPVAILYLFGRSLSFFLPAKILSSMRNKIKRSFRVS